MPTIRMTMSNSTRVNPPSRSPPKSVLRIPITVLMRDPLEATEPCTVRRTRPKSSHIAEPKYHAYRDDGDDKGGGSFEPATSRQPSFRPVKERAILGA